MKRFLACLVVTALALMYGTAFPDITNIGTYKYVKLADTVITGTANVKVRSLIDTCFDSAVWIFGVKGVVGLSAGENCWIGLSNDSATLQMNHDSLRALVPGAFRGSAETRYPFALEDTVTIRLSETDLIDTLAVLIRTGTSSSSGGVRLLDLKLYSLQVDK